MTIEEFEKMLSVQDHQQLKKVVLPDHESLLQAIRALFPTTGIFQNMFCNGFMTESVELIKHAFFLYEDGYFDCAFYSLRQSVEIMNSMLLLSDDENRLKEWKAKAWFPMDNKVKSLLEKNNAAYSEIREKIPEFFMRYDELLKKANKYIHKQGFDSFYAYYGRANTKAQEKRTALFVELMKHAIGMILIMDIALDPLSLALSDPEVDSHIPFDAMTEPIPVHMLEEFLSPDLLNRIKETDHYQKVKHYFLEKEELSEATYGVVRCQYFDTSSLADIEKQENLLSVYERLILHILQAGIPATHFYMDYSTLGYATSIIPTKQISHYSSHQFDQFIGAEDMFNILWNEMYISVVKYLDTHMVIQLNRELSNTELEIIKTLTHRLSQQYQPLIDSFKNFK